MTDPGATVQNTGSRTCAACKSDNVGTARFCAACGAMLPSQNATSAASGAAILLSDARNHLSAAQWEEAALAAEAVLAFDPGCAEAHNIIARARLKQGMRNAALVHAERAVELAPGNPAYEADVALARGDGAARNLTPALVASAAALMIFVTLMFIASRQKPALPAPDVGDAGTVGAAPKPPTVSGYPQTFPSPSGSAKPRLPGSPSVTTSTVPRSGPLPEDTAPAPAPSPSAVTGLEPAPVDQALKPFPANDTAPAAPKDRADTSSPTHRTTAAPQPQPGGTNFGPGANAGVQPTTPASPYVYTEPPAMPAAEPPVSPASPAADTPPPSPPQQHFLDRNYPDAVKGYVRMVQANPDNGAAWQQLAYSYQQLNMRSEAAQAYREAIAAYNRQIAAGYGGDVAKRGIRACDRALQMLAVR